MKKLLIALTIMVGLGTTALAQTGAPVFMTAYFVCRTPDDMITVLSQPEATFADTVAELLTTEQCAARQRGYAIMLVSKWTEVTSPIGGVTYEVWEVVNNVGATAYSYVSKSVKPFIGV